MSFYCYADPHADLRRRSTRGSDLRLIRVLDQRFDPRRVGFSLVETILALAIFSLVAAAILTLALGAFSSDARGNHLRTAQALATEGLEAARSIRNYRFTDLTVGNHGLATTSGYWAFAGTSETIGSYVRTMTVDPVYRSNGGRGDVVSAGSPGAVLDPSSRLVTATVAWPELPVGARSESMVTLMTRWSQKRWVHDTAADFTAGRRNSVQITSVGNGELRLSDFGDWTQAAVLRTINIAGNEDNVDCATDTIGDILYVATKARGSGRPEFYAYDIADVTPTTTALYTLGTTELGQSVQAVSVHDGYAYMASGANGQEMMVIRLSDYAKLSSWDTPGTNTDANDVAATGTVAYLVTDASGSQPEFFAVNIANPASIPATPLGTAEIGGDVNAVALSGDGRYAFLATDDNSGELTVVRLSDYQVVRRINAGGNDNAMDVAAIGNTVYLVKTQDSSREFYAYDASNPETMSATPIGSVELNRNITHIAIQGNRAYLTSSSGSAELLVIDLNSYTLLSTVNLPSQAAAPSVCLYGAYAYVVSTGNSQEIMVVKGGGTTSTFAPVGTFTSESFDGGATTTAWSTMNWTVTGSGTVRFKLRTADSFAHLPAARWVGADGTAETFYATSGQVITLDPGATGSRWIQLKAYLETTSTSASPVLEDVSIDYE